MWGFRRGGYETTKDEEDKQNDTGFAAAVRNDQREWIMNRDTSQQDIRINVFSLFPSSFYISFPTVRRWCVY